MPVPSFNAVALIFVWQALSNADLDPPTALERVRVSQSCAVAFSMIAASHAFRCADRVASSSAGVPPDLPDLPGLPGLPGSPQTTTHDLSGRRADYGVIDAAGGLRGRLPSHSGRAQ